MTRQMPAGAQVAFAKDWLERQGVPAETIDVESYIDRSLSYEENIKLLRREFGLGKRGMDAPKVARGMTAAECDVAIGNFDAGYNGTSARDACVCGYQDACEDVERRKAAKRKPAPKPDVTLKIIDGRYNLCRGKAAPVEITVEEAYEVVRKTVAKDLAGKRVSDKKLEEYAERHGFHGGWVESEYYKIKPSRSIESIEKDIEKTEDQAYKRSKDSRAHGGSRPGGGALDRDLQRMWERKRTLTDELERAKSQKQGATPAAAKPNLKTVKDVEQWIEKKTREYGSRNEFICSSEYAEMYPEITRAYNQAKKQKEEEQKRVNIIKNPDGTGYVIKYLYRENAYVGGGGMLGGISTFDTVDKAIHEAKRSGYTIVSKPKATKPVARKPAPDMPPEITLDFYKDVTQARWKHKYGEVFDPDTGEILAHVVLTPSDFTRRRLDVKITKWFGQYAKGEKVAYILSRIDHRSVGLYAGDSSWFRLSRTMHTPAARKTPKKPAPDIPPILTAPPELAADVLGAGPTPAAPKPQKQPAKRKPAPDLPPALTAPPELAADVLGTGPMGLTPTPTAQKRKPAARTTKKPAKKTTAAKTRKTTKKPAKPKAKKTAATPKLTASQREYLAIQGFVMVKRGGKYVRITN